MEDANLLSDLDDLKEGLGLGEAIDTQAIILENERLHALNKNLQASLATAKSQLQQALEGSASVAAMNQQIIELQSQLRQSRLENERSLTRDSNDGLYASENSALQTKLAKNKKKSQKMKLEKGQLENENKELKALVEKLKKKIDKRNSRFKETVKGLSDNIRERETEVQAVRKENEKLQNDLDNARQEIKSLQSQVRQLMLSSEKSGSETSKFDIACEILGKQIEEQKAEISELSDEKSNAMKLVSKLHAALMKSEGYVEKLERDNRQMKSKITILTSEVARSTKADFSAAIQLPFAGELEEQCLAILNDRNYKQGQKMQLILNETANVIASIENDRDVLIGRLRSAEAELDVAKAITAKCKEVFNAFLTELKSVLGTWRSGDFIEFMRNNPVMLEVPECNYIPGTFFDMSVMEKKKAFEKCMSKEEDVQMLFMSQFAINSIYKKQVDEMKAELQRLQDLPVQSLKDVDCKSVGDVVKLVAVLKDQVKALTESKQKVYAAGKKLQKALLAANKANSEQKSQIDQLTLQNDTLQNEVRVLEMKCQVALNDSLTSPGKRSISSERSEQSAIVQLEEENRNLSIMLQQSKNQSAKKDLDKMKKMKKKETQLKQVLTTLKTENEELKSKLKDQKRKSKKRIQGVVTQYQQAMEKSNSQFEESKLSMTKTITEMKDKMNESREMSSDTMQALKESEKHVQQLQSENSRLQMVQKSMQLQLSTAQEQLDKEKKITRTQITAQQLACETQLQEMSRTIKEKLDEQKSSLTRKLIAVMTEYRNYDDPVSFNDSFQDVLQKLREMLRQR